MDLEWNGYLSSFSKFVSGDWGIAVTPLILPGGVSHMGLVGQELARSGYLSSFSTFASGDWCIAVTPLILPGGVPPHVPGRAGSGTERLPQRFLLVCFSISTPDLNSTHLNVSDPPLEPSEVARSVSKGNNKIICRCFFSCVSPPGSRFWCVRSQHTILREQLQFASWKWLEKVLDRYVFKMCFIGFKEGILKGMYTVFIVLSKVCCPSSLQWTFPNLCEKLFFARPH